MANSIIVSPYDGKPLSAENGNGKPRLPRVLVGILAGSSIIDAAFGESYPGALVGHGELFWAEQCWVHGGIPDDARNQIVDVAKKNDYDYVFFMDSDQVFPKAALAKLLRSQMQIAKDLPDIPTVVGGLYVTRSDHRLNVYDWVPEQEAFIVKPVEPMSGLHRCDVVATGCLLADMGVFDAIEYPYFEYWYKPKGKGLPLAKWSEDIVFGKKCYDLGIPHFVNSDVVCPHIHAVLLEPASATEFQVRRLNGSIYYDEERTIHKTNGNGTSISAGTGAEKENHFENWLENHS